METHKSDYAINPINVYPSEETLYYWIRMGNVFAVFFTYTTLAIVLLFRPDTADYNLIKDIEFIYVLLEFITAFSLQINIKNWYNSTTLVGISKAWLILNLLDIVLGIIIMLSKITHIVTIWATLSYRILVILLGMGILWKYPMFGNRFVWKKSQLQPFERNNY